MKVERRQQEVELVAETPFEREVIATLLGHREIRLKAGRSTDDSWPPDPQMTNLILCLPDPNDCWR
jgi:hypothetical protein